MKVNVGLIGLGRLGRVYARDLATRVTGVRLAAVADTNATLAEETARELDVPRWYMDPLAMLDDPGVDAAVIVSPTDTHTALAVAAHWTAGRPCFARSLRHCRSAKLKR